METNKGKLFLDNLMFEHKLNQSKISKATGINANYLSRIYTGDINLSESMEMKIRKAFPDIFPENVDGIPYFDVDFDLGYESVFNDQTTIPQCYVQHPLNGKAKCWIRTHGQSMYPLINSGDMIAIREVEKDNVMFGEVYAIVTNEYRTVKRIRKGSCIGMWKLVPENTKDFDEQEIDISNVIKVFRVEAVAKPL